MAEGPRLPRGRHSLTREQVTADQRARIMVALAEAMAADGYTEVSVADVLRRAGVSRETFYQQFSSKRDCFLQTFDAAAAILADRIDGAVADAPAGGGPAAAEAAVGAYLDALVAEPAFAHLFLVESHAAGPAAIERRAAVQARLAAGLAELLGVTDDERRFACRAFVAAVGGLVTPPLVAGDLAAVRALRDPLLALLRGIPA